MKEYDNWKNVILSCLYAFPSGKYLYRRFESSRGQTAHENGLLALIDQGTTIFRNGAGLYRSSLESYRLGLNTKSRCLCPVESRMLIPSHLCTILGLVLNARGKNILHLTFSWCSFA